jgi:cytochrome c oxidase cbb3-type subunit I/II
MGSKVEDTSQKLENFFYDDQIVRRFVIATLLWGVVGMLVGLILAAQLAYWPLNGSLPWFTFSHLRPVHTNAVIFAFAGNTIFAGVYYSLQRLLKARMVSDLLSKIHFWGWQAIIVSAALTLPFGITTSKEYAELEWPIDIAITLIWVVFAINVFGTIAKRRERHIYVSIWFYIATILTVALLHIVNSLAFPVSLWKSYPVFAGVQDALVQWWYGHNAVAFFLTTPFLGLMYYFMPKAADRPVYSYRLSIIHFWSLIFLYIWAGPHHLLYSSLPQWAQTMGVVFSVMLIAPSWGGMINGLLTLRGAWGKLRTDVILKFLVVGITFYGMSTFEGPMMSLRIVNRLAHYTDWVIGHVHSGALGWNGFIAFGMIYWLIPRLWKREVYSQKLMSFHFWTATIGIVLYITSMWVAGVTQGLMWRALTDEGNLQYPDFIETVTKLIPFYWVRLLGGSLYFIGLLAMVFNFYKTLSLAKAEGIVLGDTAASGYPLAKKRETRADLPPMRSWHYLLEGRSLQFTILTLVGVLIGGLAEIVPMVAISTNVPTIAAVKPYTPLELEGRDIYVREACYVCHSQMIRNVREDVVRYGLPTQSGETVYDHPFQYGSKRTGPDLQRQGGKYPDFWHFKHMMEPRSTTPGSIMPPYPWLYDREINFKQISTKLKVMRKLGVPYSDAEIEGAENNLRIQAKEIADGLVSQGVKGDSKLANQEIIAMIGYLQRLGRDLKSDPEISKKILEDIKE